MYRIACLTALLLLSASASAAEPAVHRDLSYAEPKNERQSLDVYTVAGAKNRPVVFWIHGGGWRRGDKQEMHHKPQALVDAGYVFVATNYRFVPNVDIREQTGDIAKAIRWTRDHAAEYGGDGSKIVVMGHSAGAHLAALVCTDDAYLKKEGLDLSIIKGCMPVDVSVYDLPKRFKDGPPPGSTYTGVFGTEEKQHREYSPTTYIAKDKFIPPFLILYVADRPETKVQSEWLAEKLQAVGVSATVVGAEGKTHGTINSDLGLPDDPSTKAMLKFLQDTVMPQPSGT